MEMSKRWKSFHKRSQQWDKQLLHLISHHVYLLVTMAISCLGAWGGFTGHFHYIIEMILVGAVAFTIGIVGAVVTSVVGLGLNATMFFAHTVDPTVFLLETFGFICVIVLGHQHQTMKYARSNVQEDKPNQVLPWSVVNEIRTSLSAIRFLLFPLKEEHATSQIERATQELSRLEEIFHELERAEKRKSQ